MCEFEKKTVETGDIENGHETFVLYMFWILSQTYNKQPLSVPCLFFYFVTPLCFGVHAPGENICTN